LTDSIVIREQLLGLLVGLEGRLVLLGFLEHLGQAQVGLHVVHVERDASLVGGDALVRLPDRIIRCRQVENAFNIVRLELKSLLILLNSLVELPKHKLRIAEVVKAWNVLAVDLQGLLEVFYGLREFLLSAKGICQIIEALFVDMSLFDGNLIVLDGFIDVFGDVVCVGKVVTNVARRSGQILCHFEGLLVVVYRLLCFLLIIHGIACADQRSNVFWIDFESLSMISQSNVWFV